VLLEFGRRTPIHIADESSEYDIHFFVAPMVFEEE